jgi:hypothetical protein
MAASGVKKYELDSQHATRSLAVQRPFRTTIWLKECFACLND